MFVKYCKETYKILGFYVGDIEYFNLDDNEAIVELNIQDCSQEDIRAYNEDGTVKSLGQQIKEGILVLNKNEVIKNGTVVELNENNLDDYIRLVQRGCLELDNNKKMVYSKEYKGYYIEEKTLEEKLQDGVIDTTSYINEYNRNVIEKRLSEYSQRLDGKRAELIESVLLRWKKEDKLSIEESRALDELLTERDLIKKENKKKEA